MPLHKAASSTNLHTNEREYAGNPQGNVSGIKGQYCRNTVTGDIYRNIDGTVGSQTTNWTLINDISWPVDHKDSMGGGPPSEPIFGEHNAAAIELEDDAENFTDKSVEGAFIETIYSVNANTGAIGGLDSRVTALESEVAETFPVDRSPLIRNEEMDNRLSTTTGTPIVVESIDYGANTIVLSWMPNIASIFNPVSGREWAVFDLDTHSGSDPGHSGDYAEIMKITGGVYATRTLSYTVVRGTETNVVANHKIMLLNPFEEGNGWTLGNRGNPIIPNGVLGQFDSIYPMNNQIFINDDGDFVMLVSGKNGSSIFQIGAYKTSQADFPYGWMVMNSGNAIFTAGSAAWCNNGLYTRTGIFWLADEQKYIIYATGKNSSGYWGLGWIKFKKDFSSIEYSSGEILARTSTENYMWPCAIYHEGRYWISYIHDPNPGDGSYLDTVCKIAKCDTPDGSFIYAYDVHGSNSNDGSAHSYYGADFMMFTYKNRMYALNAVTSNYKYSGNKCNGEISLWIYLGDDVWEESQYGIIFMHPDKANESPSFWDSPYGISVLGNPWPWYDDHLGGTMVLFFWQNTLYLFFQATSGTDNYQIGFWYRNVVLG